jgi:DNA-binding CsgD family transcriptional regulator
MALAEPMSIVGREGDLYRIETFLDAAREGPAMLVLEGEPGIGKTILWRAGLECARGHGFRVLEARPAATEAELSYSALADLLSGTHDEIGRLPSPQRRALRIALLLEEPTGNPPDQRAVAAALLGLTHALAEDQPVLVALDDLQWLDPPSASALQFAVRRFDDEQVRVLATERTGAHAVPLENMERLSVGPLSLHELDRFVRERLGARFLRPTLRQLEAASGGNPFYALEIAASLLRAGAKAEAGEPLPIPASLRELLSERFAALSPAAHDAALAAAALAQPTVSIVQHAGRGGRAGIAEAVAAGVLEQTDGSLRLAHPILASTLYEDTPASQRRELHRRLAELVVEPEERARHLAEAADGPDEELAAALEAAAASSASRGSPESGAKLAKRAFDLTPSERRSEAHRRGLQWARLTAAAGDPKRAERILERRAGVAGTGSERAEVLLELGRARLATSGAAAAHACFDRALHELGETEGLELRTEVTIELASAAGTIELASPEPADRGGALDVSERAVALAERCGRADLLARALGLQGAALTIRDQPPSEEYWRRALEVEREAGELRYGGPTGAYGLAAWWRGDIEAAMRAEQRQAASMRRTGDPMLPQVLLGICEAARIFGDWEQAARYAQEAHDLCVQTGRESLEPFCLLYMARVALPRGEVGAATAHVEEARRLAANLPASAPERLDAEAMACSVLGQIAEVSERFAEAHEWNTAAIEKSEQLGSMWGHALAEMVAGDVRCLIALGDLDSASVQMERLAEMRDSMRLRTLDGIADRAQGLLFAAQGDPARGVALLERAVETFEQLPAPWPIQLAWTYLALGGIQRRARRKGAARQSLERALEIFDRLGAPLWAEKARDELSRLGGRPSRPGALTATEQGVADLVASGRSNAEVATALFMSPKTVEWNLSKIYKKLHVRSRTELAARLARQAATR